VKSKIVTTRVYELPDERSLVVNLTEEGIIIDVFEGGEHVGTSGMMADEWFDRLTS
jgi:hypothetical protein